MLVGHRPEVEPIVGGAVGSSCSSSSDVGCSSSSSSFAPASAAYAVAAVVEVDVVLKQFLVASVAHSSSQAAAFLLSSLVQTCSLTVVLALRACRVWRYAP